ncbi:MAG: RtcB family protein [Patescibacteria group bacterium]
MIEASQLKKLTDVLWEIPKSFRSDMKVPARIYASRKMLSEILGDRSLEQLINVATLPGIVGQAMVMPDVHEGYGFPIGAVAATAYPDGAISPGGIGYDINCGVRLLTSKLTYSQVKDKIPLLAREFFQAVPSGVGRAGMLKLTVPELDEVLSRGASFMVERGFGEASDLPQLESGGTIPGADPGAVSDQAKKRGRDQLGTMGAGNHFVEVGVVEHIFAEKNAGVLGLFPEQIVILIHTGSRGLGHQIATDYIRQMLRVLEKYHIELPDRELACVPLAAPEGRAYFAAMAAAANFAFANRQLITWEVRGAWQKVLGKTGGALSILYDVAHNIAKLEEYEINGEKKKLIVHRKGATRAFPDQPVLIPGSMGTASYVLLGTPSAMQQSFGSTCHGAGRRMSRHQAKREINGAQLKHQLEKEGIAVETRSLSGVAEEAPLAYKDVDEVVEVVAAAGIVQKVARLRPIAVIKG